jgi:hypothetical protein
VVIEKEEVVVDVDAVDSGVPVVRRDKAWTSPRGWTNPCPKRQALLLLSDHHHREYSGHWGSAAGSAAKLELHIPYLKSMCCTVLSVAAASAWTTVPGMLAAERRRLDGRC